MTLVGGFAGDGVICDGLWRRCCEQLMESETKAARMNRWLCDDGGDPSWQATEAVVDCLASRVGSHRAGCLATEGSKRREVA